MAKTTSAMSTLNSLLVSEMKLNRVIMHSLKKSGQLLTFCICAVVVSCPSQNKYDVYLTQLLTNSTITEIVNEIQGDDDTLDDNDETDDWIKTMGKTGLSNILFAKKTNELSNEYKDSLIVVFKNDTITDTNQYSLLRYTKMWTGWI